ncbi:MAG: hypothetical protein WCK59_02440 [Candidatus Falkowbacteria bacterium]
MNHSKLTNFNADEFLRRAGFAYIYDNLKEHGSYVKRLTRDYYPRLHVYVMEKQDKRGANLIVIEMHLDQKKASYVGTKMHSAEYDGEVVAAEMANLKNLMRTYVSSNI